MRRKSNPSTAGGGVERTHSHRRTRGGDLFFCFSSRPSAAASGGAASAVMRAPSSKPLLSPDRSRDPAAAPSLSASLSRRLRSSTSVKGGQSPMFPAVVGGRRKGVAFEAAEPSSPKVTCIGQVRVKSKKKKKAAAAAKASVMRSRSMSGSRREASFRRAEDIGRPRECLPSRNQVWVYQLPVSICEALRAFGSEFNCFFPCGGRSLCSSSRSAHGRDPKCGEKRSNSCGAVFARWLMAVSDNEDGKRGDVVQVVVEDTREGEMVGGVVVKERLKMEDLELEMGTNESEEVVMVVENGQEKEEDEEEARVSICIPPRNALLLMRCRSDPVRMAELATRFWDSPAMQHVRVEEEKRKGEKDVSRYEEVGETKQHQDEEEVELIKSSHGKEAKEESRLNPDEEKQHKDEDLMPVEEMENARSMDQEEQLADAETENGKLEEKPEEGEIPTSQGEKEEDKGRRSSSCSSAVDEEERKSNRHASRSKESGHRRRSSASRERDRRRHSFSTEREVGRSSFGGEKEVRRASFSVEAKGRWSFSIEKDGLKLQKDDIGEENKKKEKCSAEEKGSKERIEAVNSHGRGKEEDGKVGNGDEEQRQAEREEREKRGEEKKSAELPDCLLLMMYEPKLSMEVSKETWVCSTDFLRWRLNHPNYRPRHPSKSAAAAATVAAVAAADLCEVTKSEASKENTDDSNRDNNKAAPVPVPEISQPPPLPRRPPPPPQQPPPPTAPDTEKKPRGDADALPSPAQALAPVPPPSYGPFVLTRCKSEPMRSSARLTPDAWFWKDRHRPVGATGIGF